MIPAHDILDVRQHHPIGLGCTDARVVGPKLDQLGGSGVWQRIDQDGFDGSEHDRGCAGRDRDGAESDGSNDRRSPKTSERLADILKKPHKKKPFTRL
jgi:hypothetical protein